MVSSQVISAYLLAAKCNTAVLGSTFLDACILSIKNKLENEKWDQKVP